MWTFIRAMLAALLLGVAGQGQAAEGVTAQQITIGQSISLQGGKDDYGTAVLAGIQSYLQAVNARGGVHGRQVVLRTLDDEGRPAQAEANARKLLEKDDVFLLFGSVEGGPSNAVMKVANEFKVPLFGPLAGAPTLRRPAQPLVFPVRAEHLDEFRALVGHAKSLGMRRVAFMRADTPIGELHLANVKRVCQELGMSLVADLPFKPDTPAERYGEMAQQLEQTGAQMVFNHGGFVAYEKLIRAAKARKARTAFYAVNSGAAELVRHLGELSHGMIFAHVVPSPWERKTAITREYQEAFSRFRPGADFSYGSLEGYVTAKALVAALQLAGPRPTREGFVAALQSGATLELNGLRARYEAGQHRGLEFVDIALVTRQAKFQH